jgi:hypothetical protein
MKKIFLSYLLIGGLMFLVSACSAESTSPNDQSNQTETSTLEETLTEAEIMEVTDAEALLSDPGIETTGKMDAFLESFESELAKQNLTLTEKAVKDAASIGASEGYGLYVNAGPFEVYFFDPNSTDEKTTQNLQTAELESYITIFDVEINGKTPQPACTFHDNFVLIFPTEDYGIMHPNHEAIVAAFENTSNEQ